MDDAAPIELSVTLGESVFSLAERLPALIKTETMDDNSPAVIEHPTRLTLIAHGRAMTLPATRVLFIQQSAGVVTGVELAPMLEFGDLATCRDVAMTIGTLAHNAGWETRESYPLDVASMQADASRSAPRHYEKIIAVMGVKSAQLSIYVKEMTAVSAGSAAVAQPAARYLLNTDFLDPVVEDAANKRLFQRRARETGGTRSLPLNVWRTR